MAKAMTQRQAMMAAITLLEAAAMDHEVDNPDLAKYRYRAAAALADMIARDDLAQRMRERIRVMA